MTAILQREAFATSRLLDYFSPAELERQIGHARSDWPRAITKELVDNALDACESAGLAPEISVRVEADRLIVADNGPGIPDAIVARSLDFNVRVSTNRHYIAPTRGQLGNALKTVVAVAYVEAQPDPGRVVIDSPTARNVIDVRLDRMAQEPRIEHRQEPATVRNGTVVTVEWPRLASLFEDGGADDFYRLIAEYAAVNPHLAITLDYGRDRHSWQAVRPGWSKWTPSSPTSPHWYTVEQFENLIAAYVIAERDGGKPRTVRDLIAEFRGLSSTVKRKAIAESVGLGGARLTDLWRGDEPDREAIARLLAAMRDASREVEHRHLGIIGREVFAERLVRGFGVYQDSLKYEKHELVLEDPGNPALPIILEVAFGVVREPGATRQVLTGVNWTPTLEPAFPSLNLAMSAANVQWTDPVVFAIHLVLPSVSFADHGKTRLTVDVRAFLEPAIVKVTREWTKAKRNRQRMDAAILRRYSEKPAKTISIKEASFQVMEQAYLKASANGTLPAKGRQIMYAARPLVMALTGGRFYKADTQTFQQSTLIEFTEQHPELTAGWNVVWDDRGHVREPHTDHRVGLGTLGVRRYLEGWTKAAAVGGFQHEIMAALDRSALVGTSGPAGRYGAVLFIEKEGFDELFDAVQLRERYDLAVMSTKGMSVTAARELVDAFGRAGIPVFILHDLDKSGLSIARTLGTSTRRYRFEQPPWLVDLGLRLDDVRALGLESLAEDAEYDSKKDPRENLKESGATDEELRFLVSGGQPGAWRGQRVELNAMASDQFITWLEAKLQAHGVGKVVPAQATLEMAYRRAWRIGQLRQAIEVEVARLDDAEVVVPDNLGELVHTRIDGTGRSWDEAIRDVAG